MSDAEQGSQLDLYGYINGIARRDWRALDAIADIQPARPEYLLPFSERDLTGSTEPPVSAAESAAARHKATPEQELFLLGLDQEDWSGKRVLIVGGGNSGVQAYLGKKGAAVVSIDNDSRAPGDLLMDARQTDFANKSFDLVILKHVLNPTQDPRAVLNESVRVGKEVAVFPVLAFVDVRREKLPVTWTRRGLDVFAARFKSGDKAEETIEALLEGKKFAVKPVPHWTTFRRTMGYYFQNFDPERSLFG